MNPVFSFESEVFSACQLRSKCTKLIAKADSRSEYIEKDSRQSKRRDVLVVPFRLC